MLDSIANAVKGLAEDVRKLADNSKKLFDDHDERISLLEQQITTEDRDGYESRLLRERASRSESKGDNSGDTDKGAA